MANMQRMKNSEPKMKKNGNRAKCMSQKVGTVIPVPHSVTGCELRALAGNNAQCSFTEVIRLETALGPLRARRPTV